MSVINTYRVVKRVASRRRNGDTGGWVRPTGP